MPQLRRPHAPKVRFTDDELAALRERARRCGRPLARYIRETTLGTVPKVRRSAADDALIRELARIGNNLNQLARDAHVRDPNVAEHVAFQVEVDTTLRELRDAIGRLT